MSLSEEWGEGQEAAVVSGWHDVTAASGENSGASAWHHENTLLKMVCVSRCHEGASGTRVKKNSG